MESSVSDGWFEISQGLGVSECSNLAENVVEALRDSFPESVTAASVTIVDALKELRAANESLVNQDMIDKAIALGFESLDSEPDPYGMSGIASVEPGADVTHIFVESGWVCDKLRHGEFGGCGSFSSEKVRVGSDSGDAYHLGVAITTALSAGDIHKAADAIKQTLLKSLLNSMSEKDGQEVTQALAALLLSPSQ